MTILQINFLKNHSDSNISTYNSVEMTYWKKEEYKSTQGSWYVFSLKDVCSKSVVKLLVDSLYVMTEDFFLDMRLLRLYT